MEKFELIQEWPNYSLVRSAGGDYYIENDNGDYTLLISPTESEEHKHYVDFISDPARTEHDVEQWLADQVSWRTPPPLSS